MAIKNTHLWSASRDLSIRQWDVASGTCVQTYKDCHELNITAVDVNPAGTQVASGSRDYYVKLFDVETAKCIGNFFARRNVVTSLKYDPVSPVVYQGSEDLCVRGWDTRSVSSVTSGNDFSSFGWLCLLPHLYLHQQVFAIPHCHRMQRV